MLGFVLAILTIIPIAIFLLAKKWEEKFKKSNIPGPKRTLFFGTFFELYKANKERKCKFYVSSFKK